jgi:hypothetical protein
VVFEDGRRCAAPWRFVVTRSPMRLAWPGPWWDEVPAVRAATSCDDRSDLARLEARLLEADGRRVWAQQRARADLTERGEASDPLER